MGGRLAAGFPGMALSFVVACSFDASGLGAGPGSDAAGAAADAPLGGDGAAGGDAGLDAGLPDGPFERPIRVTELGEPGAEDDDPSLTDDLLEIYFNSDRPGGPGNGDIWVSTRPSPGDPWDSPSVVDELSSGDAETDPEVSPDGLTIYFSSTRGGGDGGMDIWRSTRRTRSDPWSSPEQVGPLSSADNEYAAAVSRSGRSLVLSSDRDGGTGGEDVYLAERPSAGDAWDTPAELAEVNSDGLESNPFLAAADRRLYFDSVRDGGAGERDIYRAVRQSTTDPFAPPAPLGELNGEFSDSDPWLSPNLRVVYFSSTRSGEKKIYRASR